MNIDRRKQMQDKLRHRRERRSGNRQTAVAAAAIEETLPSANRANVPQEQSLAAPAPLATLGDAFAAAETQPTQAALPMKEKQLSAKQQLSRERQQTLVLLAERQGWDLDRLRQAAENGDAAACFELSERYRSFGYEDESYIPLLKAAAEQNFLPAVGLYGYQLCLERHEKEGEKMIRRAAEAGFGESAYLYSQIVGLYPRRNKEYTQWLLMSAKAKFHPAYRVLAKDFDYEHRINSAAYWMKKSADAGDAQSAYDYAGMLKYNRGLKSNKATIARYYELAFKGGITKAVFPLAAYHRRYEKTLKYYATVWARGQKEKWPMYREDHGNADRAVEFYLEAARRAPELRKRILWETLVGGKEAWWYDRHIDAVLQGLVELGYQPAVEEQEKRRSANDRKQ